MNEIRDSILALKKDWSAPKKPNYCNNSFELSCVFNNKDPFERFGGFIKKGWEVS